MANFSDVYKPQYEKTHSNSMHRDSAGYSSGRPDQRLFGINTTSGCCQDLQEEAELLQSIVMVSETYANKVKVCVRSLRLSFMRNAPKLFERSRGRLFTIYGESG